MSTQDDDPIIVILSDLDDAALSPGPPEPPPPEEAPRGSRTAWLLHRDAPLVTGAATILAYAVWLFISSPGPAPLAAGHARLPELSRLSGCAQCHTEGGFAPGCLSCHEEIAEQLATDSGYHGYLIRGEAPHCVTCHSDHHGEGFEIAGPLAWKEDSRDGFEHPHVSFDLVGKHDEASCEDCHQRAGQEPFALPGFATMPRSRTFLGLRQECVSCHEDVHAGGLSPTCDECHGQNAFRPADRFDHGRYFELGCSHAKVKCAECHEIPTASVSDGRDVVFGKARGRECAECHDSPHSAKLPGACVDCHPASDCQWIDGRPRFEVSVHAALGFPLEKPHDEVACEKCHPSTVPYAERFPDPAAPGYRRSAETCDGCHSDVHGGQFAGRHAACLDCHEKTGFRPATFGVAEHVGFALTGAHEKTPCASCHVVPEGSAVRVFVGTGRTCAGCHGDPHGGQFSAEQHDCAGCHGDEAFAPSLYGPEQHVTFTLTGAHLEAECRACHEIPAESQVRAFVGTSRKCTGCHGRPHGQQFDEAYSGCLDCHDQDRFVPAHFGLSRHSTFDLTGAHEAVPCGSCHVETEGSTVRAFAGTPRECRGCHEDPHEGQISARLRAGTCVRCHDAGGEQGFTIASFEHAAITGYELVGSHEKASCESCHPEIRQRDVGWYRVYGGTSTECASCHSDPHRGQFRSPSGTSCTGCHAEGGDWKKTSFDHSTRSRFALDETHADLRCSACHPRVTLQDGASFTHYKPLGTECKDCHEPPSRDR